MERAEACTSAARACSRAGGRDRAAQGRRGHRADVGEGLLLGVVGLERVLRLFEQLFDERRFLSPYGLRAVSRYHAEHPFAIQVDGNVSTIDYEPAESTTNMFGGNSNWRGPIWMPVNYLVVSALARYGRFLGDEFTLEYPTGSGKRMTSTRSPPTCATG